MTALLARMFPHLCFVAGGIWVTVIYAAFGVFK